MKSLAAQSETRAAPAEANASAFYPAIKATLADVLLVRRNNNGAVICAEKLRVMYLPA